MDKSRGIEVAVGLFVLLGVLALLGLAFQVSGLADWRPGGGYEVVARFADSSGLKPRAPVTLAGVRIGEVTAVEYDAERFQALARLRIDGRFRELPRDSSASIVSAGLLGEKYIALQAGGAYDYLKAGDEIQLTQSSLVLEQLIGKFLFNAGSGGGNRPPNRGNVGPPPEAGDPFAQ